MTLWMHELRLLLRALQSRPVHQTTELMPRTPTMYRPRALIPSAACIDACTALRT